MKIFMVLEPHDAISIVKILLDSYSRWLSNYMRTVH